MRRRSGNSLPITTTPVKRQTQENYDRKLIFRLVAYLIIILLAFNVFSPSQPTIGQPLTQDYFKGKIDKVEKNHNAHKPVIERPPQKMAYQGKSFYQNTISKDLKNRWLKVNGFKFCDMMDGSVIDGFEPVSFLSYQNAAAFPQEQFIKGFEKVAKKVYEYVISIADIRVDDAQRYACYSTIQGNHPLVNITSRPLLNHLNAEKYFKGKLSISRYLKTRPSFKLAYLILLSDGQGFEQLEALIKRLDDGDVIIMIHVPTQNGDMYQKVKTLITKRQLGKPQQTVFLAKKRFSGLVGSSDSLFAQVSCIFELQDLADWDYLINMSNYDWPLRTNKDIHQILEFNPGYSWIDFWPDSKVVSMSYFRPSFQNKDMNKLLQPVDFGMPPWMFNDWIFYRQMTWMILSRNATDVLRNEPIILNFLASTEFTSNAEENFFATSLLNTKTPMVKADKRRFVRISKDGQLEWIGWKDRGLFPPGASNPAYLFMRPFNAVGAFFNEDKLLEWIKKNHYELSESAPCESNQLGFRDECIRELVIPIADKHEIILIPTNSAYLELAANLRCSLAKLGIFNVIHWALDLDAHEALLNQKLPTFYIPVAEGTPKAVKKGDAAFTQMLRNKPIVIRKFLNAGFNVWYLDADTSVVKDFRSRSRYTRPPIKADVILSLRSTAPVAPTSLVLQTPEINAGIMYFAAVTKAIEFLTNAITVLESDANLTDQDAIQLATSKSSLTGIGLIKDDEYPETDAMELPDKEQPPEKESLLYKVLGYSKPKVHFFDPLEFSTGPIGNKKSKKLFIVHCNIDNPKKVMQDNNLWHLVSNKCPVKN